MHERVIIEVMRVVNSFATRMSSVKQHYMRKFFALFLGACFLASLITTFAASASANIFKITSTDFLEASQGVEQSVNATDDNAIANTVTFHKVGDYAKYKITFNNSDSEDHIIEEITNDNENPYISYEHDSYTDTQVNSGENFEFLLTVKYETGVGNLGERAQTTSAKIYIKYKDIEKPDEIDIDPGTPNTFDKFKISVIILAASTTGLIICIFASKKQSHKLTKVAIIAVAAITTLTISSITHAETVSVDDIVISSQFGLYDKLEITIDINGTASTITANYNDTVSSITAPEAANGYKFDGWKDENGNNIDPAAKLTEDTKLVADFSLISYDINYSGLDELSETEIAALNNPASYTIEDSVSLNNPSDRTDSEGDTTKTFAGWKDLDTGTVSSNISFSNQTGVKNYQATWSNAELPSYNIIYHLDGGAASNPTSYKKTDQNFTLNNPTKEGYTFTGWSGTDLSGEDNISVAVDTHARKDLEFTAHFSANQYTITYNSNTEYLDDGSMATQSMAYDAEATLTTNAFVSNGYHFTGWATAADGTGDTYTDGQSVKNLSAEQGANITLYAQWLPNTDTAYTVEYYQENISDNNYTLVQPIESLSGTTGENVTANNANDRYEHFTFDSENSNNVLSGEIARDGSLVLKVYYKRDRHTITFDSNGGQSTSSLTKKYGDTIATAEFPTVAKSGSEFSGWFTAAEGGEEITGDIAVTSDGTVYAQWDLLPICKKATTLDMATCSQTGTNGCRGNGYTETGSKKTANIIYGNISSATNTSEFEVGDAFDCDVNGDNVYDVATERFYYVRSENDEAILFFASNYEGANEVATSDSRVYSEALTQLPTTSQWSALEKTYYNSNYAARLPREADIRAACQIADGQNINIDNCDFILERTAYYKTPVNNDVRSGIWTEVQNNNYYRIQTSSRVYEKKDASSKNVTRPVIEIPLDRMDITPVETATITFDARGGDEVAPVTKPIGSAIRVDDIPTATQNGLSFEGWYTSTNYAESEKYLPGTILSEDITLYAKWDATAMVNGKSFGTLQEAIDYVTSSDGKSTVYLLKDVTGNSFSVNTSRDIVLDLQGFTITNTSTSSVNVFKVVNAKLEITNGNITTKGGSGAIDVDNKSTLIINNGTKISATGTRQCVYNNGGHVIITGDAELTSTATERATVHNLNSGTTDIIGGSITSSSAYAVRNESGTVNIGQHDGYVDQTTPIIRGEKYGLVANNNQKYNIYDGFIEGKTYAVGIFSSHATATEDTGHSRLDNIEDDTAFQHDATLHDGYDSIYLTPTTPKYKITLDANGGTVNPDHIVIEQGNSIGTSLDNIAPSYGAYVFDGWFTAITGGDTVTASTTPTESTTYYAHWSYVPSVQQFSALNDATTTYFQSIATWKNDESSFQTNMDNNFNYYSCQTTSSASYQDLPLPNANACDKPKGYDTGITSGVNVYELASDSPITKGNPVSYVTVSDGKIYNMIPGQSYYWESNSDTNIYGAVTVNSG